ncbi:DUF2746 domain-containing protein [Tsukamurella tyrosinosolvens]|uniref:DUF2746 domain-containing protein n=1 Tax=Tsukamurella tyrosinosolvens TaxID=57704 RepID=UPI002DD43CBC|nr:DUF2746 domain-containing protein [Tsukamurella tyrosinosolvens]MEC4616173.1 DUF2746 domain-containing protein [Tsukamurella tyrosinosolvens]
MNGVPFNPDSWMDIVAILIVAVTSTIGAIAGVRGHRAAKQANEQVSNSHRTNLRDDLDAVGAKVDDLADAFASYVREDRAARRETNRRLDAQERLADRWHPGEL